MTAWNRNEALKVFSTAHPVCLHCCRLPLLIAIGLMVSLVSPHQAAGLEIYATSFFAPDAIDPDPTLSGILKIDLATGDVIPFIPESPDFDSPSDVVVDPSNGDIFASTLNGTIMRFDSTGTPRPSAVSGAPAGTFAVLDIEQNAFSTLSLDEDGTLNAGTFFGEVISYDTSTASVVGYANVNAPTFQTFDAVTGLDRSPTGELIVMAGGDFQLGTTFGSLFSLEAGTFTEIVSPTDSVPVRGSSNPTVINAPGDYDRSGVVDQSDYDLWADDYGTTLPNADGNGDGMVDAADYTIWRDNLGEEAFILVADLHDNTLKSYDLDGTNGAIFAVLPPSIPAMLPPSANPFNPSNSPSEILLTEDQTLIVSLLGLTQRPDNRGAILEYDLQGNLLNTFSFNTGSGALPPISGIAFVPTTFVATSTNATSTTVPEPTSALLLATMMSSVVLSRRAKA